jgi:hypothetical protein
MPCPVKPPLRSKNDIALECWNQRKELYIVPEIYESSQQRSLAQFRDSDYKSNPSA